MSELDVLRRLGDRIVPPPLDSLRETARRRDRRARGAVVGAVVAAVAAVSVTAGLVDRESDREIQPAPDVPAPSTRPLTYADGSTIHYGDATVEAEGQVVELDVTDDGVGFRTEDGRLWFTDGSDVESLGEVGDPGPGYSDDDWPMGVHPGWMLSPNAGSRLVWFEFPAPGEPEVVVYDTQEMSEVARDAVQLAQGQTALPGLLSDSYVYWYRDPDPGEMPEAQKQVRFDPTSGEQTAVTEAELLEDLDGDAAVRSILLKGDGRADASGTFHYSDGMGQQVGVDLEQDVAGVDGVAPVGAGDMVAQDVDGRPFRFDPLAGAQGRRGVAWMVQWLDDATVVIVSPLRQSTDLLACHLDTSTCEIAASAPAGIVAPDLGRSEFIG